MDLSDASLIVTSELLGINQIITIDRDFEYLPENGQEATRKHLVQIENPERHNKSLKPTP